MLEDMYKLAKRDNAQLVVAGFYIDTYVGNGNYITDDYKVDDAVTLIKKNSVKMHISCLIKIFYIHHGISCMKQNILWRIISDFLQHSGMIFRLM